MTVNHVAKWDGFQWSSLGSGTNDNVYDLVFDASGDLFAGGLFTSAGGVSANHVAKWDGETWSALGSGVDGDVYALAADAARNVYAGGDFTTAGSISANNIAKWDGTEWSPLGTGTSDLILCLGRDSAGNLYAGGAFHTASGLVASHVARWSGSVWSALGSGVDAVVEALGVIQPSHGGMLSMRANGSPAVARSSGNGGWINSLLADDRGNLYAGGEFTRAGGKMSISVARCNIHSARLPQSILGLLLDQ